MKAIRKICLSLGVTLGLILQSTLAFGMDPEERGSSDRRGVSTTFSSSSQGDPRAASSQDNASQAVRMAQRIREEFQRNAHLLTPERGAKGQHIVALLGNTGAGKSTLANFLAGKVLQVSPDGEDFVLEDPLDSTAMVIGQGGQSETLYPKSIDVQTNGQTLRIFDLPGFNDTDGSERNLVNAAFIQRILLDAESVRFVFVAGQDQFTADRSASVKKLFQSIKQLFIADQGVDLTDSGMFVATKVTCSPDTDMVPVLLRKTDSKDKEALNEQLHYWSRNQKLWRMFHPLRDTHNQTARADILDCIQATNPVKIRGVNVSALYPLETNTILEDMFLHVMEPLFSRTLTRPLVTLTEYDKALEDYQDTWFWTQFGTSLCQEEGAMGLLKEFCLTPYTRALSTLAQNNETRRQAHIQQLIQRRQERVQDIERRMEARARDVITSLAPQPQGDEFVAFDFAYHRDYHDQVCGPQSITQLAAEPTEQELVRQSYAGFIARHSHDQMVRWQQRFSGVAEANERVVALEQLFSGRVAVLEQQFSGQVTALARQLAASTEQVADLTGQLGLMGEELTALRAQTLPARLALVEEDVQPLRAEKARQAAEEAQAAERARRAAEAARAAEALRRAEEAAKAARYATYPEIVRGHEDIYERFLKGKLVYRPIEGSDEEKIELPISALSNPLEGTFDLSNCGDTAKYLSIATGYRNGKIEANASKVEIWFTPRFLVDGELSTMAKNHHLRTITTGGNWDASRAPVGIFWTWGGWNATDNMQYCDYLTSEGMADWGSENLYKKYEKAGIIRSPSKAALWRPGLSDIGWPAQQNFTFHF